MRLPLRNARAPIQRYKIQEITHKTLHEHTETEKRQHQTMHTRQDNKRQSKKAVIMHHIVFSNRERERER